MAVSLNGLRSFFSQYTQFSLWSATTFVVAFFLWLKRWLGGGVCTHVADLRGRNVVITGANAGIGRAAAISLARMGATLILACRTRKTAEETVEEIKRTTGNSNVSIVDLDLASFASVQRCAVEIGKRFANIDILINNAGLMDVPHTVTEDGFELQFEANHLGHFLLTHLLLPRLQKAPAARIVNVASNSHVFAAGIDWEQVTGRSNAKYSRRGAYSQSKLANILFTYCSALLCGSELARRLRAANSPITTYTLHPGVVATEILRHWPALLRLLVAPVMACVKTPLQGAQTTIFCAIAPGIENLSGGYFADCKVRKPSKAGSDEAAAKTLFDRSEEFIGGARFELPPDASAYVVPQAKKQK